MRSFSRVRCSCIFTLLSVISYRLAISAMGSRNQYRRRKIIRLSLGSPSRKAFSSFASSFPWMVSSWRLSGMHSSFSLCRQIPIQPVQGNIAADGGQKGKKVLGVVGRDAFPGLQIGIADAFLRVLPVQENPPGKPMQLPTIGKIRFMNGILISGQKQFYDFLVFQL